MMKLNKFPRKYFQKSTMFLYPLLGIRRGVSVTPVQTFILWENEYGVEDHKFICVYHLREDMEFKNFEKRVLREHDHFKEVFELENGDAAYVFNFETFAQAYDQIVKGQYSKLAPDVKTLIANFYREQRSNFKQMHSYLEPDIFMEYYAEELSIDVEVLEEVGELCSLPNITEETLTLKKKMLALESEII